jgi:multiple sugar transport system substrate-binding protein
MYRGLRGHMRRPVIHVIGGILSMRLLIALVAVLAVVGGCKDGATGDVTVVFKHGKIAGDPEAFRELLDRFERENPGIRVTDETLPASTDVQHQFYAINLSGGTEELDVFSMDVIWVQEFAMAGWLAPLDGIFPASVRGGFFRGPVEAVTYGGKAWAVPWYIDAGVLYYRKDLLEKYGYGPPATWDELVGIAKEVTKKEPGLYGFIWQGKQYEGLVCNVLEYIWSNGGEILTGDKPSALSEENVQALGFMRDLITRHGVTPALVLNAIEEPTRHTFGSGRALFMRNWPYAWNIFEREGSLVKGKVGVAPLPHFEGGESASTLGGWQLGINRFSKHRAEAERLISFLTSYEVQKQLALTVGYKPTRKALYDDEELKRSEPFITGLYDVFERARPRPVSPYYMMITQVLQPEFSSVISGRSSPEEALGAIDSRLKSILSGEE